MKYLLAFFLFSSTSLPQGVVFNTPTDSIYVIDFNTTPIEILSIHESTVIPIVCLNNESKKISEVKFSTSPNCLVQSLNSAFNLHIDQYVDMKKNFTKDEIKQIVKEKG